MTYSIKGYKTFRGHEGESLGQGSLYAADKKVALWSDGDWGGPMSIDFTSPLEESRFAQFAKGYLATKLSYDDKPYEVETLSDHDLVEYALCEMSDDLRELKEVTAQAKKGIAYYVSDPKVPGKKLLYVWRAPYTAANVANLRETEKNLVEIVNERLGMAYVDGNAFAIAEQNKRYKKVCQTAVLFSVKDAKGEVVVRKYANTKYTSDFAAAIRLRHPDIIEIINERYL